MHEPAVSSRQGLKAAASEEELAHMHPIIATGRLAGWLAPPSALRRGVQAGAGGVGLASWSRMTSEFKQTGFEVEGAGINSQLLTLNLLSVENK